MTDQLKRLHLGQLTVDPSQDFTMQVSDWVEDLDTSQVSEEDLCQMAQYEGGPPPDIESVCPLLIRAFGVTESGHTVCLNLTGFRPYFYVRLPAHYTKQKISRLMEQVNRKIPAVYRSHLVGVKCVKRKPFTQFMGSTKCQFLQLIFDNKAAYDRYRWTIGRKPLKLPGIAEKSLQLYESNINSIIRLIHLTKVSPAGWINIPGGSWRICKGHKKESSVDLELTCRWNAIRPVDKMEQGPLNIMSFDIEADSSHGDFPVAYKDYLKLARDLITWYTMEDQRRTKVDYQMIETLISLVFDYHFNNQGIYHIPVPCPASEDLIQLAKQLLAVFPTSSALPQATYLLETCLPEIPVNKTGLTSYYGLLAEQLYYYWKRVVKYHHQPYMEDPVAHLAYSISLAFRPGYDGQEINRIYTKKNRRPEQVLINALAPDVLTILQDCRNFIDSNKIPSYVPFKTGAGFCYTRLNLTQDAFVHRLNDLFNKHFPPVKGDRIIQIGSTCQLLGQPDCYLKHIICLGSCRPFTNQDLIADETAQTIIKNDKIAQELIDYQHPEAIQDPEAFKERIAQIPAGSPQLQPWIDLVCRYRAEKQQLTDKSRVIIESYQSEKELLLAWKRLVLTNDPDVVIGYNIFGFDFRFMYQRARELHCEQEFCQLGRLTGRVQELQEKELSSSGLGENKLSFLPMDGRVLIDLYKVVQANHKLDSYKLDNVAKLFLNKQKNDLPPQEIFIKQKGSDVDRAQIARYCLVDCILCNRLLITMKYLQNNLAMANVCKVPLSYIFMRGQGVKIHSLVADVCARQGFLMPVLERSLDPEKYEGAIVLEPETDIYFQPVAVADFNSLYPSSMISENLSHDTWVEVGGPYDNLPDCQYNVITYDQYASGYYDTGGRFWFRFVPPGSNQLSWGWLDLGKCDLNQERAQPQPSYIDSQGYIWRGHSYVTDTGKEIFKWVVSDPKTNRSHVIKPRSQKMSKTIVGKHTCKYVTHYKGQPITGVLCQILMHLLSERKKVKKLMKQHPKGSLMYNLLDGQQLALKVTANSLYGQTGANTSPIRKKDIAASTTAVGRRMIVFSKNYVESTYVDRLVDLEKVQGVKQAYVKNTVCVYGDTDSIFIKFDLYHPDKQRPLDKMSAVFVSMELCERAAAEISRQLKPPQNLEFEKVIYPFIIISKKRYHGHYFTKMNDPSFTKKSMGIVLKRRDNAPIVKKVFGGAVDIIMHEHDIEKAKEFVKSCIRDILAGKYPLEMFVTSKSLRSYYKNPKQIAHNVLAMRQAQRDPGNRFMPNDRVPYVYIIPSGHYDKKTKILQGERIETPDFIRKNNLQVDYQMYITNQIVKPVAQIFDLVQKDSSEKEFLHMLQDYQLQLRGIVNIRQYLQ